MQVSSRAIFVALLVLAFGTACKKPTAEAPANASESSAPEVTDANAPGKTTTFEEPKPAEQQPPSQ